MKAMRLFVAIQLSDEMKKALVACMHDLKKQGVEGNYVPAQNLHLTLAFIGEYDDPAKVKRVIENVPLPAVPAEPVGERELRESPLGGSEREPEAEDVCEGSEGCAEAAGHPF